LNCISQQKYQGTLDAVLDETGESLGSRNSESGVIQLALHPPRIIRAVVDYKVQNPTAPEIEFLLRDAIQLGLDVYQGNPNTAIEIEELRRRIIETGNQSLLGRELKQPSDQVTWNATNPARSRGTANNLVMNNGGNPVLFVALAHGGVAAGMDTYLRYCDETGENGSAFYVARFSTQKLRDIYPQLSPTEISYLQEQVLGKRPVLFDEDRATGKTLDRAQQFFDGSVFPQGRVIVVTNLDARGELMKLGFGKQLLEINKYGFPDTKKHELISDLYLDKIIKEKYNNNLNYIIQKDNFEDKYFSKNEFYLDSLYSIFPKDKRRKNGLFPESEKPLSLADFLSQK
jgi:hypothetical protein